MKSRKPKKYLTHVEVKAHEWRRIFDETSPHAVRKIMNGHNKGKT